MDWIRWVGLGVGVVLVLLTTMSIVGTLVVPRSSGVRVGRLVLRVVGLVFRLLARPIKNFASRDRLLAYAAPVALLGLFATWVVMMLAGFTLIFWPLMPGTQLGPALQQAFDTAGSSLFTLGFAAQTSHHPLLSFITAGVGLSIVALEIAYLPVIYGAFNRRETLVTLLASRGGSPAWGPEILARHELVDNVANLRVLYQRWEEWAADVVESHTTYPPLLFLRSPAADRNWVVGLLAVLDAASMHLATKPLTAPPEARPFIRMGYLTLREIGHIFNLTVNDDPLPEDPIQLTREEFDAAVHHLEHSGWELERDADEAWIHFRGWRVTYEALAYRIADIVDAPPAFWGGPRHALPQQLTPPTRPPHRSPDQQVREIREITRQRRLARGEPDTGLGHEDEHDHDHDDGQPHHRQHDHNEDRADDDALLEGIEPRIE